MGITIPKENKRIVFESNESNPVIVPCRKKNYLLAEPEDVTVLDAEVQPRLYRRIVVGGK